MKKITTVGIPKSLAAKLRMIGKKSGGMSVSAMVRLLIIKYLEGSLK